MKTIFVYRCN